MTRLSPDRCGECWSFICRKSAKKVFMIVIIHFPSMKENEVANSQDLLYARKEKYRRPTKMTRETKQNDVVSFPCCVDV